MKVVCVGLNYVDHAREVELALPEKPLLFAKWQSAVIASGEPIVIPPKALGRGRRYLIGGAIFGLGWGVTGACPGPLFALLGAGVGVIAVMIFSALAGTWVYGYLRPTLPH